MSFYRLPRPWNPGYAIPRYVMAEPPEQGVFVTDWLPRGTISQLIPNYMATPGLRPRGAPSDDLGSLGGSSLRGSTLSGDTLGARRYTLKPLGASPYTSSSGGSPPTISTYGQRAAKVMIAGVSRLPPGQRAAAMRDAMVKIDPTLPARAEKHTMEARKRGLAPGPALEQGIATAMTTGVVGELAKIGQSRTAPQPNSLLGLGCYRGRSAARGALGGDVTMPIATYSSANAGPLTVKPGAIKPGSVTIPAGGLLAPLTCPGYSWSAADGAFVRSKVGQADIPAPIGALAKGCPTASTGPGGGVSVTETGNPDGKMIQVGPFVIPAGVDRYGFRFSGPYVPQTSNTPPRLPADWQAFILNELKTDCHNCVKTSMRSSVPGTAFGRLLDFFPNLPAQINHDFVGMRNEGQDEAPSQPIAVTTRPDTGEDWGFYMYVQPQQWEKYPLKPWNMTDNPYELVLQWRALDSGWWDWVKHLVSEIIDAVKDVVDEIADLTCALVSNPATGAAAASAATTSPQGAAVAIGVGIAGQICKKDLPPPPPPSAFGGWVLPVLMGVGGLGLVVALTRRG